MKRYENNFNCLESIIKVEPEKFQEAVWYQDFRQSADDNLRLKAKVSFSTPIVLLERLTFVNLNDATSRSNSCENEFIQRIESLVAKGNEESGATEPHTCFLCQKVVSCRGQLKCHILTIHFGSAKFLCDLCPKFYSTKNSLRAHMKQVHCEKKFKCNICDYKTANKNSFKIHKLIHSEKVQCPTCKKQVASLKIHMKIHRPQEKCLICQKVCTANNLKAHIRLHSEKRQKCNICQESFRVHKDLRRHHLKEHYKGKVHECHCESIYKNAYDLKRHQWQIHNNDKTICEVCEKQFSTKGSWEAHWRRKHSQTHGMPHKLRLLNKSGPFICDKCGSKHQNRKSFYHHINSKHRSATIFCDLCPRSFHHKCLLATHFERDHLKLRQFECNVCGHKVFCRADLKPHMLRHGPKTWCNVCNKFVGNMYHHMRNHVEVKCPICSKIYSKASLRSHIKTHRVKKH